ncbi:MAG: hypothetical protein WDA16_05865 [Candidatus Thermoplasmatota archaeon]
MIRRTIFLAFVLVGSTSALGLSAAGDASDGFPDGVDFPPAPIPHGDTPPLGLPAEPFPDTNLDRWIALAVLRARNDGTSVPAFYIINGERYGVDAATLAERGLPVVSREEAPTLTAKELAARAKPYEVVEEALHAAEGSGGPVANSHPAPPISDSTSIPVTAYADAAEQRESGWYNDVVSSFDAADNTLASEATVNIYRYFLMTTGTPVDDVSTYCQMQQTATYEAGFRPHVGVFVSIFSPGDVGGNYGVAIDGPITYQLTTGWKWDYCSSQWLWNSPFIPSAYVKHRPLWSLGNMQYLAAHEFAHQFNMQHADANCWWGGIGHLHKTIEAFTSADDTPNSCGLNINPSQHWHWNYNTPTNTRMWAERQSWTTCYNNGGC